MPTALFFPSLSILIPFLLGSFYFFKLEKELKILSLYIFISAIFVLGSQIVKSINGDVHFLQHFFIPLEFSLLAFVYHINLKKFYPLWFIPALISVFGIVAISNSIFIEKLSRLNSYARVFECILLIFLALSFFFKTLKEMKIQNLSRSGMFWLSTAVLIYFSGTLLLFLISVLYSQPELKAIILYTNYTKGFLFIIFNLILALAIWKNAR